MQLLLISKNENMVADKKKSTLKVARYFQNIRLMKAADKTFSKEK